MPVYFCLYIRKRNIPMMKQKGKPLSEKIKKENQGKKNTKNKKKKRQSPILDIMIALILILGFFILNYPAISNIYNQYRQSLLLSDYTEAVSDIDEKEVERLWKEAEDYNEDLAKKGQIVYQDAFASKDKKEDEQYQNLLKVSDDGIMGSIEIPKIHVFLSIRHGLSEKVLEKGVGHMTGSSLPVGGTTSHCILAGHRGLPSAELFTSLDQMEKGDEFYLHVLNHTLKYEVDDIKVVLPEEVNGLYLEEGKDYVTLVTCTPYGVNSHRLLIRGVRVPYDETAEGSAGSPGRSLLDWLLEQKILFLSLLAVVIILAGIILGGGKKAKKKEKPKNKANGDKTKIAKANREKTKVSKSKPDQENINKDNLKKDNN